MNLPVVSIIGRTNVGKSTLFNRIIRSRDAIVDDQPGVTRDRKYAETDWAGHSFILVDTGGYLPESENEITREIVKQVKDAIEESDLVALVVDARTGITTLDEEIAKLLKRSSKEVLLLINKVDYEQIELTSAEFFKLGFKQQVSVSASNGRNIGDFLDEVISFFPDVVHSGKKEEQPAISLAVIGRPNVGKSSFVNALLGRDQQIVTEIPGTTRDAIDTLFKYYGQEFLLIDTAGLRKKAKVTNSIEFYSTIRSMQSIRRCDVAILIIDAQTGVETQDKKILQEAIALKKGVILAVNKWDLIEKDSQTIKGHEDEIRDTLKKVDYVPVIFISAKTHLRVFKAIELAKSIHAERSRKLSTSDLNKFLSKVIEHYPPPSNDQKEVKINYCTQVKSNPPVFAFFANAPKSIKPNYHAYIENQLRKKFGFFGVPLTLVFRKK